MQSCKEYLEKQPDGTYELVLRGDLCKGDDILIPEGADKYVYFNEYDNANFYKGDFDAVWQDDGYWDHDMDDYKSYCKKFSVVLWQRATHPEELPFIDDEPKSINDQYAEIEQVRQAAKDNVNHPGHYADSAIECIDAMEAMMTPEQFIGYLRGNIFKYQWRYEKKNGIEDLKKAQWYLKKLTVKVAEKNAPF